MGVVPPWVLAVVDRLLQHVTAGPGVARRQVSCYSLTTDAEVRLLRQGLPRRAHPWLRELPQFCVLPTARDTQFVGFSNDNEDGKSSTQLMGLWIL